MANLAKIALERLIGVLGTGAISNQPSEKEKQGKGRNGEGDHGGGFMKVMPIDAMANNPD